MTPPEFKTALLTRSPMGTTNGSRLPLQPAPPINRAHYCALAPTIKFRKNKIHNHHRESKG